MPSVLMLRPTSIVLVLTLGLGACGGGGGGVEGDTTADQQPQLPAPPTGETPAPDPVVPDEPSPEPPPVDPPEPPPPPEILPPPPPPRTEFSVGGVVLAAVGTQIDSDTNDPFATLARNGTPQTAQPIPNPVVVGGFVANSGTGRPGDVFATEADEFDRYRVTLALGQTISLSVSDHPAADLDLLLFAAGETTVIASSLGTGPTESIAFAQPSGDYDVVVHAFSGFSNYILTIGQALAPAATDRLRLEDEFVPDEVIVRFESALSANGVAAGAGEIAATRAAAFGLSPKGGGEGRAMLLGMPRGVARSRVFATHGIAAGSADSPYASHTMTDPGYQTIAMVKALRARADVATADLNYIRRPARVPNDALYSRQWHYPLINLPQAWEISTGSSDVIVAVIDTGVDLDHPDLAGPDASALTATGFDFIADPVTANDGDGIDANPDDPGDGNLPGGSSYHGTHVAGTVAALSDNSIGVAGVTWNSRIMPLRVLGRGGGTTFDIIQAVRYAAGLSNDSGIILAPEERADILNLSLEGSAFSSAAQAAYTAARDAGVIIIAAAGNQNSTTPAFPGAFTGVVSVAAVDRGKSRAPYSNFGSTIDVAAPGGNTGVDGDGDGFFDGVWSTWVDDSSGVRIPRYQIYNGTSMAAPHVAGVVALMKAIHPGLTPTQLDQVLAAGQITEDLGTPGRDNSFGHGLIDALEAVVVARSLASGAPLPPLLSVTPNVLNFGMAQTSTTLTAANVGGETLTIDSVFDDAGFGGSTDWLSVAPAVVGENAVDENGLGAYTVTVDRTGLPDSIYNAVITFTTTNPQSVSVPVTMRVDADGAPAGANTGFQFILLTDPVSGEALAQVEVGDGEGRYVYRFDAIAPGEYFIIAGSDSDNDGFLCDPGESCGAYPTVDLPEVIDVSNDDVLNRDFGSSFNLGAIANAAGVRIPPQGFARLPRKRITQ